MKRQTFFIRIPMLLLLILSTVMTRGQEVALKTNLLGWATTSMNGNLGSGKDISINALLQGICDYMNYTGEWEHRPARTSDVRNLCADSKRARSILGFEPQVGFEEGIKKTLDWYMK